MLPLPAFGRPRDGAGVLGMTFLRSTPREAYRVYSEEEFLTHAGGELLEVDAGERRGRGRWRLAGVAMAAAAVGAAGAVLAVNSLPSTGARALADGGAAAVTGSPVVPPPRLQSHARAVVHARAGHLLWSALVGRIEHPVDRRSRGVSRLAGVAGATGARAASGEAGSATVLASGTVQSEHAEFGFER